MIVPMKKAQIVVLKEEYARVIKSLQKKEVIMIINKENGDSTISSELNEALQQRVNKSLVATKKYEPKKPMFQNYQTIDHESFEHVSPESLQLLEQIEELLRQKDNLTQEQKNIHDLIKSLKPWQKLEEIPNELKHTKYTRTFVGYILTRFLTKFEEKMKEENYLYQILDSINQETAIMVTCFFEDEETLKEQLKQFEYNDYALPQIDIMINDYIDSLVHDGEKINEQLASVESQISELSKRLDELRVLSDQILTQQELDNISCDITLQTKIIEGWVRSDMIDDLHQAIKDVTEFYEVELNDPVEGEVAPTYTKNPHTVSQFETITDMFSKPSQKDVDPNPVMSVWYWILFGMMMGDAGYGLLMIIACLLFKKIAKPKGNTLKLANVIMYSGVPTIIWGILFGSYFGFNPKIDFGWDFMWYWFNPMNDPITMLIVSVAVGALHLVSGLVIKCYICIREKAYIEMLSKNLSWIFIIIGGGIFIVGAMAINNVVIKFIGLILLIIGVLLIVCLAGASKKSIFGKVAFGLLGLYDATSYLGDLLSYSRVLALAMSSAAVAVVMNTLAQMVGGSIIGMFFAAIIFIVGHLFNLVLGLLSAYVHDSRLQYIEFFGKFYEGGGIDFKPLSVKTKYIKEIK
ncbi:MAG: V-type ATP synthase subunit I [Bacilli bacterium]